MSRTDPLADLAELPGVAASVLEARDAVDRLRRHRVLRRSVSLVAVESARRGAHASAALEGADASVGALRLAAGLGELAPMWSRAPLQALARAHLLAAGGQPDLLPADLVGRPRPDRRHADPLALGPAPSPTDVGARLDALGQLLGVPTSAPALVVAAVAHGELLVLQPFAWGSGLVARAAQRLVMISRGVDPHALSVPEVGHRDEGAQSYAAAARAYASGTPEGVGRWLRHCAEAVRRGAAEGLAICEALQRAGPRPP